MERWKDGQSEHIFSHEDVHWGPGRSAGTWAGREGKVGEEGGGAQPSCSSLDRLADEHTL